MAKAIRIPDHNRMYRELIEALADAAYGYALPHVAKASTQLGQALDMAVINQFLARISVPHYWAVYLHDGTDKFSAGRLHPFGKREPAAKRRGLPRPKRDRKKTVYLVWFRNPLDDPRLRAGKYPERVSQIRRLTKAQWDFWSLQNKIARKRGTPPPMIFREEHPGYKGNPFFSNKQGGGMYGFKDVALAIANEIARRHIRRAIEPTLDINETLTISL